MFLVGQSRQQKFHAFARFFHFKWVPTRDWWELISVIQKNCLETFVRWVNENFPFRSIILQTKKFNQASNIVTVEQWRCFIKREQISKFSLTFPIPIKCCSRCHRRFFWRREPSSWADSLERLKSRVRLLKSIWVKGTGWSSSSGLHALHSAVSVM